MSDIDSFREKLQTLVAKFEKDKPPLSNNIKCGNSLIEYDIFDGLFQPVIPASKARRESFLKKDSGQAGMTNRTKLDDETKSRINPFDRNSKSTGFGEIMENAGFDVVIGNPPYVLIS